MYLMSVKLPYSVELYAIGLRGLDSEVCKLKVLTLETCRLGVCELLYQIRIPISTSNHKPANSHNPENKTS